VGPAHHDQHIGPVWATKNRLKRMQYKPALIDGFLAATHTLSTKDR
jgi:hypothetical protein